MAEKEVTKGLVRSLFEDAVIDQLVANPKLPFDAVTSVEKARRFAQQGTVPGAKKALQSAKVAGSFGSKFIGKLSSPIAQSVIELGKAGYIIGKDKDGQRKEAAKRGESLLEKPIPYQIGNLMINPAESLHEYGAAKERMDLSAFEEAQRGIQAESRLWIEKANAESAIKIQEMTERERLLQEEARRAADPDFDVKERTMSMISSYLNQNNRPK